MAPEHDSGGDLAIELGLRRAGLVPPVDRDHGTIGLGGRVHDGEDGRAIVITAEADVAPRMHDRYRFAAMSAAAACRDVVSKSLMAPSAFPLSSSMFPIFLMR
jgi:hypothetical protein